MNKAINGTRASVASTGARAGLSRRAALALMAAAGLVPALSAASRRALAADQPTVFTWDGYNMPELYPGYEAAHGALPNFVLFADLDEAFSKLQSGFTADVSTPGAESIGRWRDAGLMKPIDTSRLANWSDLFPGLATTKPALEDGVQWGVPFGWGASSIVYRTDLVGDAANTPSWNLLWDKQFEGKLAMMDSSTESTIVTALALGIADPFNMTADEVEAVRAKLVEQRPLLRYYWGDATSLEQSLASGEIVAAFGWSSSFTNLRAEGVPVGFMVPQEGLVTWIDFISLLAGGEAPEELQYAVIDAMTAPEAGAFLLGDFGIASPNQRSYELVDAAILNDLGLSDPSAAANSGVLMRPFSAETDQRITEMFNEVKAG